MSQNEIHEGDVGTSLEATIYVAPKQILDLSTASVKNILFRKPDGTVHIKTADFVTDGTDGKLRYVTIASDFDQTGDWSWQARLEFTTGTWSSNVKRFFVYENVDS